MDQLVQLTYLVAAVLFIVGLKGLTRPKTAVRGNLFGALAMFIAVAVTLLQSGLSFELIGAGVALGSVIGVIVAVRVR